VLVYRLLESKKKKKSYQGGFWYLGNTLIIKRASGNWNNQKTGYYFTHINTSREQNNTALHQHVCIKRVKNQDYTMHSIAHEF